MLNNAKKESEKIEYNYEEPIKEKIETQRVSEISTFLPVNTEMKNLFGYIKKDNKTAILGVIDEIYKKNNNKIGRAHV